MTSNKQTTTQIHTNGFKSGDFKHLNEWLSSFHDKKKPSAVNNNPKVNAEIHSAITKEPSEYISSICDHLFTLYHNVQQRPFVLQFLPSFVTIYYDVLYHHHHLESIDPATKDVCSTIDTFFVSLYNLSVTDDEHNEKAQEFRIPNLTVPSIYHTPNPDHYAPTPLTQHTISKHDTKCEIIRLPSFTPFDSINGISREPILWFLLIQYGAYVSSTDKYSRQSYLQMSKKLLGQGFPFNGDETSYATKTKSGLPPTGRRIHVSSRIMSEILSTLYYFHSNSTDNEASECMLLLRKRAEYEMYADVILMTESFEYLHEFESRCPTEQDTLGIEIESAPTLDIIKQKRSAATARSIKVRQRFSESIENPVLTNTLNVPLISPSTLKNQSSSNGLDENSNISISPSIDQARSNISSSIGPIISTPSSSPRLRKPVSLESPRHHFKDIQQQGKSPQLQTRKVHDENQDTITVLSVPRKPTIRQVEQKDVFVTIKPTNGERDETGTTIEETYL